MSTQAIALQEPNTALAPRDYQQIAAQRTAISNLMAGAMKDGIDYGKIPGTPKPTLFKPGAEKLLSMFHLAAQPVVEDLSTPDVMRYRVFVRITDASGRYLGEGVGEASSGESKYKWRAIVCDEEFQMTPEDRRRVLWKKGQPHPYPVKQVRTEMEDIANTVLKMAKKRAQIDAVLTVTAASDVFMQDAGEIVDAGLDIAEEQGGQPQQQRPATLQPKQQPAPIQQNAQAPQQRPTATQTQQPASNNGAIISEAQAKRFWAIASGSGYSKNQICEYLESVVGVSRHTDIPRAKYEEAVKWAEGNF